jgi:hypothetical protein
MTLSTSSRTEQSEFDNPFRSHDLAPLIREILSGINPAIAIDDDAMAPLLEAASTFVIEHFAIKARDASQREEEEETADA